VSGFQEILIVAAVVLAVIILPRLRGKRIEATNAVPSAKPISGRYRLAIAASIIYPVFAAAVVQPWKGHLVHFLYGGIGPVVFAWLLYWVLMGFRKKNR
jgi:hypothetical protein